MINLSIKLKKNFSFGKPQKDEKNLENKEIFLESQEKTKKINLKKNEQDVSLGQEEFIKQNFIEVQYNLTQKTDQDKKLEILSQFPKEKLIQCYLKLKAHCKDLVHYYSSKLENRIKLIKKQKVEIQGLKGQINKLMIQLQQYNQTDRQRQLSLELKLDEIQTLSIQMSSQKDWEKDKITRIMMQSEIGSFNFSHDIDQSNKSDYFKIQQTFEEIQQQILELKLNKKLTNIYQNNEILKNFCYQTMQQKASAIALIYCIFSKVQYEKDMNNLQLPRYLIDFVAQTISNKENHYQNHKQEQQLIEKNTNNHNQHEQVFIFYQNTIINIIFC